MTDRVRNVLFLCTGNSARSVMAEALLGILGSGRFRAFSAGSHPSGKVQPMAAELAQSIGYDASQLRSRSWDEFSEADASAMDIVITVCDNAAGESCPLWLGHPVRAHWGVADPVTVTGGEALQRQAYADAFARLRRRVERLLALPLDQLGEQALAANLSRIGELP